jgi:hypothetical protein
MWGKGPPKDNVESWQDIQLFIAEYPDDGYWSKWKPMVRGVVYTLEAHDLVPLFRVGQSMHHILISTLDHHRLTSEPRVTLEFHPNESNWLMPLLPSASMAANCASV